MSFPSPLLHIPTRRTEEVDFATPMKSYIRLHYEQEPEKFKSELAQLHRLRQDVRGAGKDLTGRDILYRYYGQLELLDLRFPIDENHVKVSFTWYVSRVVAFVVLIHVGLILLLQKNVLSIQSLSKKHL